MSRYIWAIVTILIVQAAMLLGSDSAAGDAPLMDVPWTQEDPKFGVTQSYCLYTGDARFQAGARKAFNAVDGHFSGIVQPVQFQEVTLPRFSGLLAS